MTRLGRAEAGGLRPSAGADEAGDALGALRRLGLGGGVVPVVDGRRVGGVAQGPGQPGSTGCSRAASRVRSHQARERVVIGLVGGRLGDPPVEGDAQVNARDASATFWWMKLVANRVSDSRAGR